MNKLKSFFPKNDVLLFSAMIFLIGGLLGGPFAARAQSVVNGTCGSAGDMWSAPKSNLCSSGSATTPVSVGTGAYAWYCDGINGGSNATCGFGFSLVNGACGSVNGTAITSAPWGGNETLLCSSGIDAANAGSGPWTWKCDGLSGGSAASCSVSLANGVCGSANGLAVPITPSTNLCANGVVSPVSGSGPWTWECEGASNGTNASCLALLLVNGSCGSANGLVATSAPASNLCASGTATALSGSGPWTWNCTGTTGVPDGATASCSAPTSSSAVADEEFVGPFANWVNVKTAYGAKGDGVTDDTAAIQNALNSLKTVYGTLPSSSTTLYFPAGTYLISNTLTLAGQIFVSLIGQDPATTTLLWGGASGSSMLYLNGVAYSRFDRLTFNGQGAAGVAVDQSKATSSGNYFDTSNEYADDVFENAGTGLRCGHLGYGCSETSMLRDKFINNSVAGVNMGNFNALDMWIWYSLFQNNRDGVSNEPAGNFHVYNSIFENSSNADIEIDNGGTFNFRNNYSIGSNWFLIGDGATNNPYNVTIEGNTILDTTSTKWPGSIGLWTLGPMVLIDNTIRSLAGKTGPVVQSTSFNPSELFSMGNTYTVSSPISCNGTWHSVNDQIVDRSTVNPVMPTLPGTPPNNNRQIFEVTPGSSALQIQQAINLAAASGTVKPVVHIQMGNYSINATLVVPAGSDMQIIGDGWNSGLNWTGTATGPVIQLLGPSKATLRDFRVSGNGGKGNGIEVDNVDQPGSRVFMEQSNLDSSHANLFVDGLDYTNVELHDFQHTYNDGNNAGITSVNVTGGPSAASGSWLGGATNIFAGAAENSIDYGLSSGGHLGVRDVWHDAGGSPNLELANITGSSTFTDAGSVVFLNSSSTAAFVFNNFQGGTAALVNLSMTGGSGSSNINITGNGANAQLLGLGLVGDSADFWNDSTSPADTTEFLVGQTTYNAPSGSDTGELAEQGTADPTFLAATLNQVRTQQPSAITSLPSGVTDVRFYRMYVSNAINGIHLEGNPTLNVAVAGTGYGMVFGPSNIINCGANPGATVCTATVSNGTNITLTAAAANGSVFTGWSGGCSGTGTCVVTMRSAQSVTATFNTDTVLYGDINGAVDSNGNPIVTIVDAQLAAQAAIGLITLTPSQQQAAEVSGSGKLDMYDAYLIAEYAIGLINKFPVQ